jgi:hypothetical protein
MLIYIVRLPILVEACIFCSLPILDDDWSSLSSWKLVSSLITVHECERGSRRFKFLITPRKAKYISS